MDRKIVEMFRDGKSASAITKILDKSKGYVIKVRDLAEQYGFIEKISDDPLIFRATERVLPQFPEILFPIEDLRKSKPAETDQILAPQIAWIKERLDLGWSPQTIFEELKVSVPRSNFYRYLERQHLQADRLLRSSPEIVHAPGECLQVDWAKLFDIKDPSGKSKTVWAFIGILGHSRYTMVRVMQKCDFAATVTALTSMFDELGGTPKRVTSDNPKVFVNLASKHEPLLNAGYERFSSYYGFTIEALPPSDPQKKGKVERTVQLVRRLFESLDQSQFTMEYAQAHADLKLSLANQRKHGTHGQRPASVFESEKLQFKGLPQVPYELETIIFSEVRKKASGALNILDRFHIAQKLSEAVDKVRSMETKELTSKGKEVVLKKSRWCFLKKPENLTDNQKVKLKDLLACNLKTIRAYLLKEDFQNFWDYQSPAWAGKFMDQWCTQVMRSKLEPMKKVAKTLRAHKVLLLNWFEAKNQISLGAVEGQNNKAKVVIRKSYGFRTAEMLKILLYHKLGKLPVPE